MYIFILLDFNDKRESIIDFCKKCKICLVFYIIFKDLDKIIFYEVFYKIFEKNIGIFFFDLDIWMLIR